MRYILSSTPISRTGKKNNLKRFFPVREKSFLKGYNAPHASTLSLLLTMMIRSYLQYSSLIILKIHLNIRSLLIPDGGKLPLCPGIYIQSIMISTAGRGIHSPEYIPCHERLFTGGEAIRKKRDGTMMPSLFQLLLYLPRR